MASVQEIRDLKSYFVEDLYIGTRGQQLEDDTFYHDTFTVPQIHNVVRIQRTGRAARMIDRPLENIITTNPQLFRKPLADTSVSIGRALAVSAECNRWLGIMRHQNPNPFKEFGRNLLLRGEGWYHVVHNERWVTGKIRRIGLPILLDVPDPMTVYADPNEDENGIPVRVIVWYPRKPNIIKERYPQWTNPKAAEKKSTIDWLGYYDESQIYFEADGQEVLNIPNPYGFNPWVHALSGFGKQSPSGDMEDLIVGRLRKVRDTLRRECAIVSDIDSTFHLFADRSIDVQPIDSQHEVPEGFAEKYERGVGLVHELPFGITVTRAVEELPSREIFEYLYRISAELDKEDPLVLSGAPAGETGRQQDMTFNSAMRRYETIVESIQYATSAAIGMGLEICEKIPTLCPKEFGMKASDIEKNYAVSVKLKADNPVESDRQATLGSRHFHGQEIDLRTLHTRYMGLTQEESEDIITNMLVDNVTFQNPDVAELIGMKLAEKAGMLDDLKKVKQRRQTLTKQVSPTAKQRLLGETQTPLGQEMADMSLENKGARRSPTRFVRQ